MATILFRGGKAAIGNCNKVFKSRLTPTTNIRRRNVVTTASETITTTTAGVKEKKVMSRYIYERYKQKLKAEMAGKKDGSKKTNKSEDTPWPKYMVIGGYVGSAIMIPYTVIWIILTNNESKEYFFETFPSVESTLRQHFGEEEIHSISYADRYSNNDDDDDDGKIEMPYILAGEEPHQTRHQQGIIEDLCNQSVQIRLRSYNDDDEYTFTNEKKVTVPGNTLANLQSLRKLSGTIDSDGDDDCVATKTALPPISVDFSSVTDSYRKEMVFNGEEVSSSDEFNQHMLDLKEDIDELSMLKKTSNTLSLWNYGSTVSGEGASSAGNPAKNGPTAAGKMTDDEIQISKLEHEIEIIEKKLKDPTCMESLDDLTERSSLRKGKLRKLKWKQRLSWLSY